VLSPVGAADVRAAATVGAAPSYRAAGTVECGKLGELVAALPGSLAAGFTLAGRGTDATDRRATLRATIARGMLRGVPLSGGAVAMELDGEALRIVAARLDGPDLQATASGTVHLGRRTVDLELGATRRPRGAWVRTLVRTSPGRSRSPPRREVRSMRRPSRRRAELETPRYRAVAADRVRLSVDLTGPGWDLPPWPRPLSPRAGFGSANARPRAHGRPRLATRRGNRSRWGDCLGPRGRRAADRLVLSASRSASRTTVALQELVWNPSEGPAWRLAGPAAVVVADEVTTPG